MQTSDALDKIAPAFVAAQHACEGAKKVSENAAFKQGGRASKYADLSQVWDACQGALQANGLAAIQAPGQTIDGKMHMDTRILHTSGQWLEANSSMPLPKSDPQGYGSATTYLRRYALAAMMGVIQEDDDGNAASNVSRRDEPQPRVIDDAQRALLFTLAEQSGADMKGFCTFFRIGALPELPDTDFGKAKAMLEKKLADKAGAKAEAA